jgi:hypothetical protein
MYVRPDACYNRVVSPTRRPAVALQRFRVVAFETVFPIWADQVARRGGGIAFCPIELGDWSAQISNLVHKRFVHHTVRSAEVGIATLDTAALLQFCQRDGDIFWQGGDTQ